MLSYVAAQAQRGIYCHIERLALSRAVSENLRKICGSL
jgi:hypothetical protein